MELDKDGKPFRYQLTCKLPSCKKPFGTNRDWQEFCPKTEEKNCQQEWHRLLRKKHGDVIVEVETLKEAVAKLAQEIKDIKERFGNENN